MVEVLQWLNNSSIVALIAFILPFLIFFRRYVKNKKTEIKVDPKILEEKVKKFKPEPLIKPVEKAMENSANAVKEESRSIIDLAKINYLNLLNNKDMVDSAVECINQFGVGTCGPRAFFGTTEVHENLEKALCRFLGTQDALVYAYGFVTASSAIKACLKPDDLIFCDEYVNFSLKQGMLAARSEIIFFSNNNPVDLSHRLEEHSKRNKRKFLILEGIYEKNGIVCKLAEFIKIAAMHKTRIFLDESISIGVVGINGKGMTEHAHVSINDIDLIIGSLENSFGSIGGFCAGTHDMIEFQRLNSTGYAFSASLPTYLCDVALKAIPIVENNSIFLQVLATKVQEYLISLDCIKVISDTISPLKILNYYRNGIRCMQAEESIYEYCRDHYLYLILNKNGLIMHLNVELYFNEDRRCRVYEVLLEALLNIDKKIFDDVDNIRLLA